MNVVSLVPFRHDPWQPRRDAIWDHIREKWYGWNLYVGDNPEAEFDRASSINLAAEAAGKWDVAVISDADCLLSDYALAEEACRVALEQYAYVVPHRCLVDVTRSGTARILEGSDPKLARRKEVIGKVWGGMFAIPRKMWDETGGFDKRFWGYGGEDLAFVFACGTIGQQLRLENAGELYHLWHGWVPGRKDTEGYSRNMAVVGEYHKHLGDPAAMREYLAARR